MLSDSLCPLPCKKALVTGGSGFIGAHLVRHLQEAGWEVHLLARRENSLPGKRLHAYTGEVSDVVRALEYSQVDTVFHLASHFTAQHSPDQITSLIQSNILLGTQLLEAMTIAGVRVFVNTSTSWQYFHQDSYDPVNLYAATKQAFEDILMFYVEAKDVRAINLTLFDSYGPGDTRKKLLALLLESLNTGSELPLSFGEQMIDLAHVDDICAAFVHAARLVDDRSTPALATYAVSGGERMPLRDIVRKLEQVAGRKLAVHWGARPYRPRSRP